MNMAAGRALEILTGGEVTIQGQFLDGSNYTFFAEVELEGETIRSVYKPVRGEMPLWDFPTSSLAHREVAAWLFSELLGWQLVPPTIYRRRGPLGGGSLQLFINHDPKQNLFTFPQAIREGLRPAALFDLLINNADRKGGHFLLGEDGWVWLIDHGVCFHREDKLRTVLWDFAGEEIPESLLLDLSRALDALDAAQPEQAAALKAHLKAAEIRALMLRMERFMLEPVFPQPPSDRRYYPWPPV